MECAIYNFGVQPFTILASGHIAFIYYFWYTIVQKSFGKQFRTNDTDERK